MTLRCCKCCKCCAKAPASIVLTCRRTSAGGAASAAPATQNDTEVLQVLRLPRKTSLRYSKCCTCHAKAAGVHTTHLSPDFRGPLWRCSEGCTCHGKRAGMLQVLRLPRKTSLRCSKCCTCHAKQPASIVLACCRTSTDLCGGAASFFPARQNEPEVPQVLHMPRKSSRVHNS